MKNFDPKEIISRLARNKNRFKTIIECYSDDEAAWSPEESKWSLTEIFCHLRDEEVEDMRARTKHCLELTEGPFTPIDPAAWVQERAYANERLSEVGPVFLKERSNSVKWLRELNSPEWNNAYQHPKFGEMPAGLFLSNWLAHDILHLRQILKWEYAKLGTISPYGLNYAGDW